MTEKNPRTLLYLDGVSVSFDGFKALNSLSFVVEPGELRAIIGPNGAGKTTMMDIITGKTRPDEGEVFFKGDIDLTKRDEAEIAQLGIGRKFQKPTVFENHTVWDNLELALNRGRGVFATLFYRLTVRTRGASKRFLRRCGLQLAGTISPPVSLTGRSNGWRSACCLPRNRNSCSSTSRWRG